MNVAAGEQKRREARTPPLEAQAGRPGRQRASAGTGDTKVGTCRAGGVGCRTVPSILADWGRRAQSAGYTPACGYTQNSQTRADDGVLGGGACTGRDWGVASVSESAEGCVGRPTEKVAFLR